MKISVGTQNNKVIVGLIAVAITAISLAFTFSLAYKLRDIQYKHDALAINKGSLIARSTRDENSTLLPYYDAYLTTQFVGGNKTVTATYTDDGLHERNPYAWLALGIWRLFVSGYNFGSLIRSCRDWSSGGEWAKADCVIGAVDTGVALAATGYGGYTTYATIGTALAQNGVHIPGFKKRGNGEDLIEHNINVLTTMASALVDGTGHEAAGLLHANGSIATNDQTGYPIMVLRGPTGLIHHMSTMQINDTHHTYRIATSHEVSHSAKRNEQFNLENFSEGGIEFGDYRQESQDTATISTDSDYGMLDHQLSCQMSMDAHAYQYVMWDNNHDTSLCSGWFHAYQYDPYYEADVEIEPYPGTSAPDLGGCYVT